MSGLLKAGLLALAAAAALAACRSAPPPPDSVAPAQPAAPRPPELAPGRFTFTGELTQGGWIKGRAPPGSRSVELDGRPVEIAADGGFLVGFDRDAPGNAILTARLSDGRILRESLGIAPRAWQIEHIGAPLRPGGGSSEAFRQRRAPELARIAAARALRTGAQGWRQQFVWPAQGRISGRFGSQRIYAGEPGSYHSGLDIAGGSGTVFVAPADGVVILAAETPFSLEGRLLMIDHGNGLNSAFLHCSELMVREGEQVRQGQPIGRIGMTGRATGPHLHWSIKWQDARLDPILFTGPPPGR